MKINLHLNDADYAVNLSTPFADLSMPVSDVARAWYIDAPAFHPVVLGDWKGSVAMGGGVNFFSIDFNPHAHGTHTETAGHITEERHSIHDHFKSPFTIALVLYPLVENGKVSMANFEKAWQEAETEGGTLGVSTVILKTDCGDANRSLEWSSRSLKRLCGWNCCPAPSRCRTLGLTHDHQQG